MTELTEQDKREIGLGMCWAMQFWFTQTQDMKVLTLAAYRGMPIIFAKYEIAWNEHSYFFVVGTIFEELCELFGEHSEEDVVLAMAEALAGEPIPYIDETVAAPKTLPVD